MSVVVGRVDAPGVAGVRVRGVLNAVKRRVPHCWVVAHKVTLIREEKNNHLSLKKKTLRRAAYLMR
jgi:hypothetical protein